MGKERHAPYLVLFLKQMEHQRIPAMKRQLQSSISLLRLILIRALLSWFKSYLSDRVQWVKVFGCKSSISKVSSGVPQGGHLSPILFSLYVNGIKEIVKNCELLMFADDLKLFRKIENLSDCSTLQNDLNNLVSSFNNIGLQFNVNKCHSMSFLRNRSHINYTYSINGSSVTSVCSRKDLGIIFNTDLNFHSHTEMIRCKALKTLGFVMLGS
jgi:hypothetical protein